MIWHSFREANKVAHLLAKEGSKQAMRNQLSVFLHPPTPVWTSLQADREAVTTKKIVSVSMYNNLARLGNLSVVNVEDAPTTSTYTLAMLAHNRAFVIA